MNGDNERAAQEFGRDVDTAIAKKVIPLFLEFHKSIVIKAFQLIIRDSRDVGLKHGSPVWSGRFNASHNVSIGTVDGDFSPPNPAAQGVRWPTEPSNVLRAKGLAYVRTVVEKLRPFDIVYISNSVPYARRIEAGGFSMKAPNGVYTVAANTLKAQLKSSGQVVGFIE